MNLVEKLKGEVERYQNKPFLKAAMAICALTALADGRLRLGERARMKAVRETMERLRVYDPQKGLAILHEYLEDLKREHGEAATILKNKIGRYAGDHKSARTLLRIAFLVLTAGGPMSPAARQSFDDICDYLAVNAADIWEKLSASSTRPTS
jgi:tellurite resistance protein TerB